MKHIFFQSSTRGSSWHEDFWFSSLSRHAQSGLAMVAYGESHVFDGCDFRHPEKLGFCYMELIIRGKGTLTSSDGSRHRLSTGSLYLLSAAGSSRITVPAGGELVKLVIGFHNGALFQLMLKNSILAGEDVVKLPPDSKYPELLKNIGKMAKEGSEADDISTECYRLLLSIASHNHSLSGQLSLQPVCEYMQSQLNNQISLKDLAGISQTSTVTLIRKFREQFGCTPMQYLIDLRMNYARTLLQLRQIPIKNVAELCGYRNAKFFSREYHKKFGIAPSEEDRIIR